MMNKRRINEIVNADAERLQQGVDVSAELLASAPPNERANLEDLLWLARRLKASLRPVEPRPAFVRDVKSQLAPQARQAPAQRPTLLWIAAGVGGVLYLVSLAMLSFRAALLGKVVIYGILSHRAVRPALSKAQPAP